MRLNTYIVYETNTWQKIFSAKIRQACTATYLRYLSSSGRRNHNKPKVDTENILQKDKKESMRVDVSVVLANNAFVQNLNRLYRGQDKPTNVLSFSNGDIFLEDSLEASQVQLLGDIIIAYECVAKESKEQGKSFEDHLLHLVVHGMLHLLGLDHVEEQEAEYMESLECLILKELAIANPYLAFTPQGR